LLPSSGHSRRPSPAVVQTDHKMSDVDSRHVAGLMRINHTGEVCAQALYQGQALTAKLPKVRKAMEHAAEEEIDHLVWCEQRIHQLGSHTSVLNPLFYGLSFGMGAAA
ncbi:demethoxyubiquinone hydroxylase family protein, partial [Pseudomonas viridiflava]